jgi:uncharacterized protein YbcI
VLVTNMGGPPYGAASDRTDEEWQRAWELVTLGVIRLCRAAAGEMAKRGGGSIVNITTPGVHQRIAATALSTVARMATTGVAKSRADFRVGSGIALPTGSQAPSARCRDHREHPSGSTPATLLGRSRQRCTSRSDRQHCRPWRVPASFLPAREPSLPRETRTQAIMARQHDSPDSRPDGGALSAAISEAVVGLLAENTGRGPTKARTTLDRDLVVVVLQNSLTPGERFLADNNRIEQVLDMRRAYQEAMRSDCIAAVEELTGRTVAAFMSANHVEPDVAAEVFILTPESASTT